MKEGCRRVSARARDRFEVETLLALKMREGTTSQEMQAPLELGKGKETVLPEASRRDTALPTP